MLKHVLKYWLIALATVLSIACKQTTGSETHLSQEQEAQQTEIVSASKNQALLDAFARKQSDVFLEGEGVVKKLLPDDNKGARHQKFLVSVSDKQTLLFAHNIDLAPRVEDILVGDIVAFRGEYIYNPKGGVMHWTHHDPQGRKAGGWIKHNGKTYE